MKTTVRTLLRESKNRELYQYAYTCMEQSRRLYNAALFRLRQNFTARKKDSLTQNEKLVMDEVLLTAKTAQLNVPKSIISYRFLEKLMRATGNPDFFSGLPMQSAQEVLKQAVRSFKGWLSALRAYKKDPSVFTGIPKMPGYRRQGTLTPSFLRTRTVCFTKGTAGYT